MVSKKCGNVARIKLDAARFKLDASSGLLESRRHTPAINIMSWAIAFALAFRIPATFSTFLISTLLTFTAPKKRQSRKSRGKHLARPTGPRRWRSLWSSTHFRFIQRYIRPCHWSFWTWNHRPRHRRYEGQSRSWRIIPIRRNVGRTRRRCKVQGTRLHSAAHQA